MSAVSSVMSIEHFLMTRKTKILYGFDFHGVIDKEPEEYKKLFNKLRSKNGVVFVLSGQPKEDIIRELESVRITEEHYNNVFSIVDFLKSKKIPLRQDEKGNWWARNVDWWSAKARICTEIGVDYMFDDTYTYSQFFVNIKTEFVHVI